MSAWNKQSCRVLDLDMAYAECGSGDPIVFLHGNPVSSFLWRRIAPELADLGRCIAPDLLGMGDSAQLPGAGPGRYSFSIQQRYLDALLDQLGVSANATLVVHDWGSALGFDWARRHANAVAGIAYMEAIVRPLLWDEWPQQSQPLFRALRGAAGEELILDKNVFVERILPASILRTLDSAEMAEYRRPFAEDRSARWPTLDWPRQLPLEGEPAEICELVQAYADWLQTAPLPKLFINAEPGAILVGSQREFCRQWPAQTEVTVPGIHFIQEDSPAEIVAALRSWLLASVRGGR